MPSPKQRLVVIEPALKEAGGHHAGFADLIARSKRERPGEVIVYTHRALNSLTEQRLLESGCGVRKHFSFNFYRVLSDPLTVEQRLLETNALADQLADALSSLSADASGSHPTTVLYPSFGLEHFAALVSACYREVGSEFRHLVCMMFRPGAGTRRTLDVLQRRGGYGEKLRKLRSSHDVRLFASDWELAHTYKGICQSDRLMAFHPVYLASADQRVRKRARSGGSGIRIMIYAGDAKDEKGFNGLPGIARELLRNEHLNATVVIQYTSNWGNRSTVATEKALRELAATEPRLELHNGYWSESVMRRQLSTLALFVFSHRAEAYADKSSGVLWLLGASGVPLVFMEQSWLTREADRLALPVVARQLSPGKLAELAPAAITLNPTTPPATPYRAQLFAPFWPWIRDQMSNVDHNA
ncbi:MAG: hypothetical protein AAGG11_01035 [Pseudomonadota bacterium]